MGHVILSFETGLGPASVALWRDGVVTQRHASDARANAAETLPLAQALLAGAGLGFDDLTALACGIGPGSFTGIRIGLAAARGLALATRLPLYGVSSLEATAQAAQQAGAAGALTVAIDAARAQLFVQRFRLTGDAPEALDAPALLGAEELRQLPEAPVAGNAAHLLEAWLPERRLAHLAVLGDAGVIAKLAARAIEAGIPLPAIPLYVRAPDAKLPKDA